MMRAILTLGLFLFSLSSFSTHILGGTITYNYLSSSSEKAAYTLDINIYRDCLNGNSASLASDSIIMVGIYDNTTKKLIKNESIALTGLKRYSNCINNANICIDIALYRKNIELPKNDSGFIAVYSRCCYGTLVTNLYGQANGISLFTFIPPITVQNNSPQFYFLPQFITESGKNILDYGAGDADGDSLVYSIANTYTGGSLSDPVPNPSNNLAPPKPVTFVSGYGYLKPFGSNGTIKIDSKKGSLAFINSTTGVYALTVEIKEYRNTELIGIHRRTYPYFFINVAGGSIKTTSPVLNKPLIINNLKASLSWEMCNLNVSQYLLERKTDISSWKLINSSSKNEPYTDTISTEIKYYYRIRAVVKSDTIYSNIETVFIKKAHTYLIINSRIKIFPNPFLEEINLELSEQTFPVECNIYDLFGVLVQSVSVDSKNFKIHTSEISKGLYMLEVKSKEGNIYKRIIK